MIRVVMVDDDRLVESGVASMLIAHGLEVAGLARDVPEGVQLIIAERPDIVLCDVMLGGEASGLDIVAAIAGTPAAGTPVILLSSFAPAWFIQQARASGAAGYLTKDVDVVELVAAIESVLDGGSAFPVRATKERVPSAREIQVIRLAAEGWSNSEIGRDLGLSPRTVESHLARLFERYGVADRIALSRLGVRKGWIAGLPEGPVANDARQDGS